MKTVDKKYLEGFNIGYWLARGDTPEQKNILNHLVNQQPPGIPYTKGLRAGRKQMEQEKMLEQIHAQDKTKDPGIEHEI